MFFLASELKMTIKELTSKITQERINHEQENAKSGTLK